MRDLVKKKELGRFLIGGSSAVITDYLVYTLLLKFLVMVSAAKLIAFVSGSIVGFIINKFWTFESKGLLRYEIIKYAILYAITAYWNVFVNNLALNYFLPTWLAFLFATGASTIANFLGQKFFVFRKLRG